MVGDQHVPAVSAAVLLPVLEGLEETFTSASLALGGAVHSAVEHHFNELMVGNPAPDHDTLLNAFWDGWRSRAETAAIQLGKGEDLDAIGKTADRVITAFRASEFAQPQGRILGVEEELRSPLISGCLISSDAST